MNCWACISIVLLHRSSVLDVCKLHAYAIPISSRRLGRQWCASCTSMLYNTRLNTDNSVHPFCMCFVLKKRFPWIHLIKVFPAKWLFPKLKINKNQFWKKKLLMRVTQILCNSWLQGKKVYCPWFILVATIIDVSRYILILDTSILVASNMNHREYWISKYRVSRQGVPKAPYFELRCTN
jgi:hypothetical protein